MKVFSRVILHIPLSCIALNITNLILKICWKFCKATLKTPNKHQKYFHIFCYIKQLISTRIPKFLNSFLNIYLEAVWNEHFNYPR